jgi:hypothetical protein
MTPEPLADGWIEGQLALAEAATPGPWFSYLSTGLGHWTVQVAGGWIAEMLDSAGRPASNNAQFIAAARTGYPVALRMARRVQELESLLLSASYALSVANFDEDDSPGADAAVGRLLNEIDRALIGANDD